MMLDRNWYHQLTPTQQSDVNSHLARNNLSISDTRDIHQRGDIWDVVVYLKNERGQKFMAAEDEIATRTVAIPAPPDTLNPARRTR